MRTLLVALSALLLAPSIAAHGAPEPRETDDRLLADTGSSGDYGGPEGALDNGGLDLLALDAREGTFPGTTDPALYFRVIVQGGEPAEHRIDVHGEAGGSAFTLDLRSTDLRTYTSTGFEAVRGPFDVGDGHPKAIEGIIRHSSLGIAPGEDVTDIHLESHKDDGPEDAMPGSWYLLGEEVPLAPTEDVGGPATMSTSGPEPLFTATADVGLLELAPAGVDVTITLNSLVESIDQTVAVNATAPDGVIVVGSDQVPVDAAGSGTLKLRFEGEGTGAVHVLLESELGYGVRLSLPIHGGGDVGAGGDVGSGELAPGESYQYTFTAPATFEYHCHPHPWMLGSVTIAEQQDNATAQPPETHVIKLVEPSQDDPQQWRFEPADITINVGDTVVWVNDGQAVHDVRGSTGLGGGHDHDHHGHGDADASDTKDTPAPFLLTGLAAALLVARRH